MPTAATINRYPSDRPTPGGSSPELLFRRYKHTGDRAAREALAERFLPLARKLARRYANSSEPYEDLVQIASLALVKAIDRFDPERGASFQSFAIPTILGELRRYFRDSGWSVHVPRGAQERAVAVQQANEELGKRHGRSPTVQQIAVYLELGEEEVLDGLQAAQAYATTSLDAPPRPGEENDELTVAAGLGVEDERFELIDAQIAVGEAMRALPPEEQRMLRMRFVHEMTQSAIGAELGVSQMQVSRQLRRSLERLRTLAGAEG